MYGLVNKAIKNMVCERFGEETWETIQQKAEVEVEVFLSMEPYPDDLTHRLVKAAALELGMSAAEILQAFGEYWILYIAKEGYGEMMDMTGDSMPEFLENLDNLHTRLGLSFPHYNPPSFECTDIQPDSLQLHYHSTRAGFAPMVKGLLKGLGERFQTEIDITETASREQGADHDQFSIDFRGS